MIRTILGLPYLVADKDKEGTTETVDNQLQDEADIIHVTSQILTYYEGLYNRSKTVWKLRE